jgi:small redox-active disulfide protein 2
MKVKVLGPGCTKCRQLFVEAERAVAAAGVDAELEKVETLDEIMSYGVMMTPALVVDGEVKCAGRVATSAEIASWLTTAAGRRTT